VVIDTKTLKEKIGKRKMSIAEFSRAIGIDPSTFYRKMEDGGLSFTVGQMHKTGEVLNLTASELGSIFLFENSQKCE